MAYRHWLHEQLLRDGWPGVEAMLKRKEQEDVDLDFKVKLDPTRGDLDKKEREILAPALSAMANSMGGAVIYGIDCRKGSDQVDGAEAAQPITGLARFTSDLRINIPNLAMPRLEEVSIDVLERPGSVDCGIVMISVARSERRPHRSEAAGDKRYYKRSGSNTVQMEHFDIEDAFSRQSVARLELGALEAVGAGTLHGAAMYQLLVSLKNVSNVTAKFPFVEIVRIAGARITGHDNVLIAPSPDGQFRTFAGGANMVIHPGQSKAFLRLPVYLDVQNHKISWIAGGARIDPASFVWLPDYRFELSVNLASENARSSSSTLHITGAQLEDLLRI